jgi:hypothetical protein
MSSQPQIVEGKLEVVHLYSLLWYGYDNARASCVACRVTTQQRMRMHVVRVLLKMDIVELVRKKAKELQA